MYGTLLFPYQDSLHGYCHSPQSHREISHSVLNRNIVLELPRTPFPRPAWNDLQRIFCFYPVTLFHSSLYNDVTMWRETNQFPTPVKVRLLLYHCHCISLSLWNSGLKLAESLFFVLNRSLSSREIKLEASGSTRGESFFHCPSFLQLFPFVCNEGSVTWLALFLHEQDEIVFVLPLIQHVTLSKWENAKISAQSSH
jgi:hypothetical protein